MKPIDFHLVPSETALIVIDMQNGFCSFDGSISKGGGDVTDMNGIIPQIRELVMACREAGIVDIWTLQQHYKDDITKIQHRITPHTLRWSAGATALKDTWDSDIIDDLADLAQGPAEMVIKHRFSAFMDTRLDTLLRMKGIKTLIVTGVATSHCVETTVRDGYQKDYDILVPNDAVAALNKEAHDASLYMIDRFFGVVMPSADILDLIKGQKKSLNLNQGWTDRVSV